MSRKLDFLIAGAQKAGTTALHSFLKAHPQLFLATPKELHFFDNESLDWSCPNYDILHAHFPAELDDKVIGEATPIYTWWPPSLDRIKVYNPKIKCIVMLRNPVERAYSNWAMVVSRGAETLSFSTAIRDGRRRAAGPSGLPHRLFSYVERGLYAAQIERLLARFPRERLLFLRTEDLAERQAATLDQVCAFLGVSPFSTPPPAAYVMPVSKGDLPPISEADRSYLTALYREDIAATQALSGLDLSHWARLDAIG
jgi:hypothetical protein